MFSKPPFFEQSGRAGCALACLRMILAQQDTLVTEDELAKEAGQEGWLDPAEVAALAKRYDLDAHEEQLRWDQIVSLVREGTFPIVYVYRKPLDGVSETHAVIPIRVTRQFVTILDPLRGERRVSQKRFEAARSWVRRWCVVWTRRRLE
jgi:ABC-type bacteriocin/lantibiotic exporter with double-glycine peptidase domain